MKQVRHSNEKLTIGVLYGFRALMVLFVCNYHFWQQSWLIQKITLFGSTVYFDFFTRSGYLFVDGMLLLSGFLLYLPHAQAAEYGTPTPDTKSFYWKRFLRIVPSYLASVLLSLFFIALPGGAYANAYEGIWDVLTHLTFTFPFFQSTYLNTPLNGVLWTIGIEVQFYLLFPLLVRAMRKKPLLTLSAMIVAGLSFRLVLGLVSDDLAMLVNQLPAFLDVYALGMLGSILYIHLKRWTEQPKAAAIAASSSIILFAAGVFLLLALLHAQSQASLHGITTLWQSQWIVRLPFAITILLLVLSAAHLPRFLQKLLDNRLMRFLATISMNLYIWHQTLDLWVIRPLFPDTLHDNPALQLAYTLLCYSLSILTAMAFTYGLEQPAARALQNFRHHKGEPHYERPTAAKTM